ncbi:MAG: hypothetical protein ACREM8_04715, partial [Vulcanimicrobiaceae bacterium]
PRGPLHLPFGFVRDVRGTITAYTPQLADAPTLPSDFRGAWFAPKRFREAYDAVADGGRGMRIVLMEDATDRADVADLTTFVQGHSGTPLPPSPSPQQERNATFAQAIAESGTFGADPARVHVDDIASPSPDDNCRRDDRGQEPTIDVDAAITLAPAAGVEVRYDAICLPGGDGTLALARALDSATPNDVIVFPFVVAAVYGPSSDAFGPVPIPYLEAAVRGIPLVVPSGDDGAYGVRTPGIDRAAVTYPCVLAVTICAGGTEVGTRNGQIDEGPWNDGLNAGGGGISADPRPAWQTAPSSFEFSPQFVTTRMVPDVSADAAGHLYIFWHGYGTGGVGGTSESAALVGAELAAINAAVPADRRLISSGDLYTLAAAHPPAVRDVTRPNDRNYGDNTLRPRLPALPKNFVGVLPSPPPVVVGCAKVQPRGCAVKIGYDAVTGLGSLKERAAIDALRASPSRRQASLGARS